MVSDGTAFAHSQNERGPWLAISLWTCTHIHGAPLNTRKVDHGQPPNSELSMLAGRSLLGSGQPIHLGICDKPRHPHFKAAEVKGHPNRSSAVTSTPTFSKVMKKQTVPRLLPKLGVITHLSASPTHGFLCSYSPHWLLIFTMSVFSGSCMNTAAFLAVSKGRMSNISLEDAGLKQLSGECFPRKVA